MERSNGSTFKFKKSGKLKNRKKFPPRGKRLNSSICYESPHKVTVPIANSIKPKAPTTKAKYAHQDMMVIDAGYAPKKFQVAWGKWIKQSGINDIDLQRLITAAESFRGRCCHAGLHGRRLSQGLD